jgi:hypothetical protein
MGYFTLVIAIAIAAVAAWYSIVGLMAIFAAAAIPIAIMGIVLEVGKLVTASWLYRNWRDTPFLLKSYLTTAVAVLMLITSMGIFGFLSKAHIDQNIGGNDASAKIERLNKKIATEQKIIERSEGLLETLDSALDRYIELGAISKGLAKREEQALERNAAQSAIQTSEAIIDKLEDEKAEYTREVRAFEVEVGPIKYIADLIYGEGEGNLDEAVRAVILLLIFVFDPLAVLLLIAANQSLVREQRHKRIMGVVDQVMEEDKNILAELDDDYEEVEVEGPKGNYKMKRPKEWLTGKLVVDKDNVSKL